MNRKFRLTLTAFVASTLFISACDSATSTTKIEDTATVVENDVKKTKGNLNIAYINNDSLLSKYEFFIELSGDFEKKTTKVQKELETRGRSLERKMVSAQEKIEKGLVTRADAMKLQQSLQQEQQELIAYRDKVLAELGEEEQVMSNQLYYSVNDYIKKYNEDAKYDLILNQNSATNTIIIGSPDLDITAEVLEGLNKEYIATKAAKDSE